MPSGGFVDQIGDFLEPSHAIWLSDGRFAVADRMADEIIMFNSNGIRLGTLQSPADGTTEWDSPNFLSLDQHGAIKVGKVPELPPFDLSKILRPGIPVKTSTEWIIPDIYGHSIHHFSHEGVWKGKWGVHAVLPHEGEGKLHYPNAVAISPDETHLIVCEGFEGRIQVFKLGDGEPESPPLISNVAHFGKFIDSYDDLILVAEPEVGDIYLLRTGLKVPIELSRFGGEGIAPHQFQNGRLFGLWIGDGVIKVSGDNHIKTFIYNHDSKSSMKQRPGMVQFQKLENKTPASIMNRGAIQMNSKGLIETSPYDYAIDKNTKHYWVVKSLEEEVICLSSLDSEIPLVKLTGFVEPQGIAIESNGNILVSDIGASHIKRFSPEGELLLTFGEKGYLPEQMCKPAGITILEDGTIVVIDWGNHRAQLYNQDGLWQATFGRGRSWTRE